MKRGAAEAGDTDNTEALKAETDEITGKIDALFDKLANKLRAKAEKAKAKVDTTKSAAKRAVLLRRFELYADAASHLEDRMIHRRGSPDAGSD
jgi:hypothetical protein